MMSKPTDFSRILVICLATLGIVVGAGGLWWSLQFNLSGTSPTKVGGILRDIVNDVRIKRGSQLQWEKVTKETLCHEGDTIFTGPNGTATLDLGHGNRVLLAPNGLLKVTDNELTVLKGEVEFDLQDKDLFKPQVVAKAPDAEAVVDSLITYPAMGARLPWVKNQSLVFRWNDKFDQLILGEEIFEINKNKLRVPMSKLAAGKVEWSLNGEQGKVLRSFEIVAGWSPEYLIPNQNEEFAIELAANRLDKIKFSWLKRVDGVSVLQIARDQKFQDIVTEKKITGDNTTWSPQAAGAYFWRVGVVFEKKTFFPKKSRQFLCRPRLN